MITERQSAILCSIIEQYAEIVSPVGSVMLAKLFDVSSATIRSEMAKLEDMGYIFHPHTSAGRIPTDKGYRFYVNTLAEKRADEIVKKDRGVKAIETIASSDDSFMRAIKATADSLAELTGNLSLATIGDHLYVSGVSNLFNQPEFYDRENVLAIARLIDNLEPWLKEANPSMPLNVFIGTENPIGKSSDASLIIAKFSSPYSDRSYIGVLGSTRQDYLKVLRLVGHAGQALEKTFKRPRIGG
jgi:heat-inducible transcription repressor hrcA